jgi:hypothetical protein
MTIFQTQEFLWFGDFLHDYPDTMNFRDLQGSLTWKKFLMTVFEFIGQFSSKMMFLNSKEIRARDQSIP